MKSFFKDKYKIILLIVSVIFFGFYNYLNFSISNIFNSPDETANFVFTQTVAEGNKLFFQLEKDYGNLNEFIHPRSTFVEEGIGDKILPVGFWGMPVVYGVVGKIIGMNLIVFLTSVLAIFGVWAFFGILKKIFSEKIAFWSSLVLFFQPVLWYYTARSMFHNVPFVSLILIGLWLLITNSLKKIIEHGSNRLNGFERIATTINDILGMSIFMLGVLMRPNEIIWIALCAVVVVMMYRKEISFSRLLTWVVVGLFFVGLYGWINFALYGSSAGSYISSRSLEVQHWYSFLFPFGVDIKMFLKSGWFYFFKMFWWYVIPAVVGFAFFKYDWWKNKLTKSQKTYGIVFVLMSLFLFLYYGSNTDTLYSFKTISVAYTRYWLPIFVGLLPFVIYPFTKIKQKQLQISALIIFCIFSALFSTKIVYGGLDGLKSTRANLVHAQDVQNWVLANTKPSDIIVTDREDKFFWPKRQVIVRFFDSRVGEAIDKLIEVEKEVYYFGPWLDEARAEKVYNYLNQFGLKVEKVKDFENHEIYKIKKAP